MSMVYPLEREKRVWCDILMIW